MIRSKHYFLSAALLGAVLLSPALTVAAPYPPTEPQVVNLYDHSDGRGNQDTVYLNPPAKLLRFVGKSRVLSLGRNGNLDAVALNWKNYYLFFETGGQTGLDFGSNDWRYPYDSPQGRILNLLVTVDDVIQSWRGSLQGLHQKWSQTLGSFTESDRTKFQGRIQNYLRRSEDGFEKPRDLLLFPRNPESQAYLREKGFSGVYSPNLSEIHFRLDRPTVPRADVPWVDTSLDLDLVTHEVGHYIHNFDFPGSFAFPADNSGKLFTPLSELSAELTSYLHTFSTVDKCKRLMALTKGSLHTKNESTFSYENSDGQDRGVRLEEILNSYSNFTVDYALTEGAYDDSNRQYLPNGYLGSGSNDPYRVGWVALWVLVDVQNFMLERWKRNKPEGPRFQDRLQRDGEALYAITQGLREAHAGALITRIDETTLSSFLQDFYRLLPITLKGAPFTPRDWGDILGYFKARGRASNLRVDPQDQTKGLDETPGTDFQPAAKSAGAASYIASAVASSPSSSPSSSPESCSCSRPGPYREFRGTEWVYKPGQDLPTFNHGPTKGVPKDKLEVVYGKFNPGIYEFIDFDLQDHIDAGRSPDDWRDLQKGEKRYWPDAQGNETYDEHLNG